MRAKALRGQAPAQRRSDSAPSLVVQLVEHVGVVGRVGDDGDVGVVLGRGADHRRAADVDLLDRSSRSRRRRADRLLERVEVDDDQVDRRDAVLVPSPPRARDRRAAPSRPPWTVRVQRLDAAVHDLGKAGELGHVADRDAGLAKAFAVPPVETSSTPALASAAANSTRPVLSETDSSARRTGTRSGAGIFLEATAMGEGLSAGRVEAGVSTARPGIKSGRGALAVDHCFPAILSR